MKNKLIKFCLILTIFTIIIACSEKKEVKDLAKIQQEKGVPTTTYKVKAETFFTTLLYTASVTGKTQTSVYAMIDAEIEDIHAKVGDFVEKDALIMEFPKNKPSANYIQYKAVYENSEITYERMKNLYKEGAVSKQELDNIKAKYTADKANMEAASKLIFYKAPIKGNITYIGVQKSDNVKKESLLYTIANTEKLKATLWASQDEIKFIEKGQEAYILYNDKKYFGKVANVSLSVDPSKNAFAVFTEFDNQENKIPAGIMVDIYVYTYKNNKAKMLNINWLKNDEKGAYVFLQKDSFAVKQYIKKAKENSIYLEVKSGLNFGDIVLTSSLDLLNDSTKIIVK